MALVLRGDIYHAALYNRITKKTEWESLGTRDEDEAQRLHDELKRSRKSPGSPWGDFCIKYLAYSKTNKEASYKLDKAALDCFNYFQKIENVREIKPEVAELWKSQLKEVNKKPHTINRYLGVLKSLMQKALEWGYLGENPLRHVRPLPIKESPVSAFTLEDIERIRKATVSQLQRVFIEIAFLTGLRRSEMQNLKWSDINFKSGMIRVDAGKNRKIRFVPLHPKLKKHLLEWRKKNSGEYVLSESGKKANKWNYGRRFKAILKRAGLEGSIHKTRHTWISHLALSGANMNIVQKWAGHADIKTTNRIYTHVLPHHGKEEINLLKI